MTKLFIAWGLLLVGHLDLDCAYKLGHHVDCEAVGNAYIAHACAAQRGEVRARIESLAYVAGKRTDICAFAANHLTVIFSGAKSKSSISSITRVFGLRFTSRPLRAMS